MVGAELAGSLRRAWALSSSRSWLVEAKQSVIENMAPVLTKLFTPLFTAVLLVFLATMAWTGSPINVQREVLIAFDVLLALVVGLVLYAASARDPQAPPDLFDKLQLLLVVTALVVDAVALAAIAARINEFGFTPNRVAALGENLILLVNLAGTAWLYMRFVHSSWLVRRPRAMADRLPARLFPVGSLRRHRLSADLRLPLRPVYDVCKSKILSGGSEAGRNHLTCAIVRPRSGVRRQRASPDRHSW